MSSPYQKIWYGLACFLSRNFSQCVREIKTENSRAQKHFRIQIFSGHATRKSAGTEKKISIGPTQASACTAQDQVAEKPIDKLNVQDDLESFKIIGCQQVSAK